MKLVTVRQLAESQPALTEPAVRDDIFHAARNGLADHNAIIRKGKRVYIVEERYFAWLVAGVQSWRREKRKGAPA